MYDMKKTIILTIAILLTSLQLLSQNKARILVLIHSESGGTYKLAKELVKGIEEEGKATAVIKQVKPTLNPLMKDVPVAVIDELADYDGIAFGSPVYFGNMSGSMRSFLDGSIDLYTHKKLAGKPATVFMSAGSGDAHEAAILSFWNTLAVHGMIIVPAGTASIDRDIAQGNTVFGATSLQAMPGSERPSDGEKKFAILQGKSFAHIVVALHNKSTASVEMSATSSTQNKTVANRLKESGIILPDVPAPAGNYTPFTRSGNLIYINQVALKEGKILYPGTIGKDITEQQAKDATYQTMLNIIAVLKEATNGDLEKVKQCVQLTGMFNTEQGYTKHADLMNVASDLNVLIFGDKGKHTRATLGASSLPLNSSVEIQAVFEIE